MNNPATIEAVEHFAAASNPALRVIKTGMIGAPLDTGPRIMRLTPLHAAALGVGEGSGTAMLAYGNVGGQFRATAINARHTYIEPIEKAAKSAWIAQWAGGATDDAA